MLPQGFYPKHFSEIFKEVKSSLKEYFGQDIDITPMNPVIKFSEIICREIERLWVNQAAYFDSTSPWFASGRFLDDIALMFAKERKIAQKASGYITFTKSSSKDIVILKGSIVNNNSPSFLKEFAVDADTHFPGSLNVKRTIGSLVDAITSLEGYENFFGVTNIEWISTSTDGSSPYSGGGIHYTWSAVNQTITWVGATRPADGVIYFVRVTGYSIYVPCTAKIAGSAYNSEINELYNSQINVDGISNVLNTESILNGTDLESDRELRQRLNDCGFFLTNDAQMESWLKQLHRLVSAKVITQATSGHFKTIIKPDDDNAILVIYNSSLNEVNTRKGVGNNSIAIVRQIMNSGALPVTDNFFVPYKQANGISGVWKIAWVSINKDGSSPYISGTDYEAYADYDNKIVWKVAGANPTAGKQYFVKMVNAMELAETTLIKIDGKIIMNKGYNIDTINNDLFISINKLFNSIGINKTLFWADLLREIMANPGIQFISNIYITLTMRLYKGTTVYDTLFITGSGYNDVGKTDIVWISDNKTGLSPYAATNYAWNIPSTSVRRIDWTGAASKPANLYPYWAKVLIKGDVNLPEDTLLELTGVDLTL